MQRVVPKEKHRHVDLTAVGEVVANGASNHGPNGVHFRHSLRKDECTEGGAEGGLGR